jgi:hypothetical protein
VLLRGVVAFIEEIMYGTGRGIERFAGHIVATGICMTVIGKVLVVAFVMNGSVTFPDGSVVGAGVGTAVIALPGAMVVEGSTSAGFGPPGLETICMPAKAP